MSDERVMTLGEQIQMQAENQRLQEALRNATRIATHWIDTAQRARRELLGTNDKANYGEWLKQLCALHELDLHADQPAGPEVCRWKRDKEGFWWSTCGGGLAASVGDVVVEHDYCPKCSKPLEVVNEEEPIVSEEG